MTAPRPCVTPAPEGYPPGLVVCPACMRDIELTTPDDVMEPFLDAAEVAKLLKVSKKMVYDLAASQRIPLDIQVQIGRLLRFRRRGLLAWKAALGPKTLAGGPADE